MVFLHGPIPINHHVEMAKSVNSASADPCSKLKQINQFHKNRRASNSPNHLNIPACEQFPFAIIDVIILIAVICACGFLLYPYARMLVHATLELYGEVMDILIEEIAAAPMLFGFLGLSIFFSITALITLLLCTDRRCGKPGCRGLSNAAEFDIQLETEDCVKNSNFAAKGALSKGLFELRRDHHRELEAELKKMAPPNGRAVMVFRARCGCAVGRMEVPGARKNRKVKK